MDAPLIQAMLVVLKRKMTKAALLVKITKS